MLGHSLRWWPNVVWLFSKSLRRWPNIKATLGRYLGVYWGSWIACDNDNRGSGVYRLLSWRDNFTRDPNKLGRAIFTENTRHSHNAVSMLAHWSKIRTWLSPPGRLCFWSCWFVCLSVCVYVRPSDYLKNNKRICIKLWPEMCVGPRNNESIRFLVIARICINLLWMKIDEQFPHIQTNGPYSPSHQ